MDYKKLERDILDLNPGYLDFIQTVKEYTGINNHNLHLIWGYVDLLLDDNWVMKSIKSLSLSIS